MNKRLLMSVAAAALIAGTGFATAQNPGGAGAGGSGAGMSREAPGGAAGGNAAGGGAAMRGSEGGAAAADRNGAAAADHGAQPRRDEATDTTNKSEQKPAMKQSQTDDKMQRDNKDAGKNASNPQDKSKTTADSKSTTEKSTTTTGQAGAGAKLTTEQRTKVTTVIKQQNVKPVTNVNFSINIGTRVPRDVEFHPVPQEIVTVYPDWRGYDFILVNGQIVIINPSSYEIVAVIDA